MKLYYLIVFNCFFTKNYFIIILYNKIKMNNIVQSFDSNINSILEDYVRKPTVIKAIVQLLLMLYAVRLAPTPPPVVLQLFTNTYFKLFIFSLILWTAQVSPSTSILIAVAFMITVNYTTTGKVWERMDNTPTSVNSASVTPDQSAQAVQVLAEAASSPVSASPSIVDPVAKIAMANITSSSGASAIQALSQQASTPIAGTPSNVASAVQAAMSSIPSTTASTSTPAQSAQAVQALAQAASSPSASPISSVIPVASIAMANTTSASGASAIQALATQASTPMAGTPDNVGIAAQTAMNSISGSGSGSGSDSGSVSIMSSNKTDVAQAIQTLASAASSPSSASSSVIVPAANVVASVMSSADGIAAVQALAQQAMTPSPGTPANVAAAVQTAISSATSSSVVSASTPDQASQPAGAIVATGSASSDSGCYPLRNYDMKKVIPMKDGAYSFEDYQQFMPTKQ